VSDWKRFEQVKGQRDSGYASLMKDGRLVFPQKVARALEWKPGDHVEIYHRVSEDGNREIGIKHVGEETLHSTKLSTTGRTDEYDTGDKDGRHPGLVVSLRSLLSQRGIVLSERIRVP